LSAKNEGYSEKEELEQLRRTGERIFGLKFDTLERAGSEANFIAYKSKSLLFSSRLDSRTYFVQDLRYGVGRELGVSKASKREQLRIGRTILKKVGIPSSEVAEHKVVTEKSQTAQVDKRGDKVEPGEVEGGRNLMLISRKIEGLPVWDSNVVIGLTENKQIGFMQLHWPEIPAHVVREAHKLAYKLKREWSPPTDESASVESAEAGITHSPAIGFVMDIFPAIRVIYRSKENLGRKKVLYLDRHGKSVPLPRQAEMPFSPPERRSPPKSEGA